MEDQTARNLLALGLRNIHAMENQSQELMERQAERLAEFLEVHSTVNKHLEKTRTQLRRLEDCPEALEGGSIELSKILQSLGNITAATHAAAGGEVLRNPALRERLGSHAKESVRERFLMSRLLEDWIDLLAIYEAGTRLTFSGADKRNAKCGSHSLPHSPK